MKNALMEPSELELTANMLEKYAAEIYPDINESGQKHFVRVMMECAAEAIIEAIQPRPLSEWHEDMGDKLWWMFPITEPPYCGGPLDLGWPGYHTHFTDIPIPSTPGTPDRATAQASNEIECQHWPVATWANGEIRLDKCPKCGSWGEYDARADAVTCQNEDCGWHARGPNPEDNPDLGK